MKKIRVRLSTASGSSSRASRKKAGQVYSSRSRLSLSASEVPARLGAAESSVRLWARSGRFPRARREETPVGSYWMIPEAALADFKMRKPGPKPNSQGSLAKRTKVGK